MISDRRSIQKSKKTLNTRILCVIFAIALIVSLTACNNTPAGNTTESDGTSADGSGNGGNNGNGGNSGSGSTDGTEGETSTNVPDNTQPAEDAEYTYELTDNGDGTVTVKQTSDKASYTATFGYPSGTEYSLDKSSGALSFTYTAESTDELVFTATGEYCGSLKFTVNEGIDAVLELSGFTVTSNSACPIYIAGADGFDISAKKDTDNGIYDKRTEIGDDDVKAAVYSECDLKLKGAGTLKVVSDNGNGIHSKDDITVQKLILYVSCLDNALKGNDEVKISSGDITLIARHGDGIKTSNTALSSKGKQKGSVTVDDGILNIYAACDGIDVAFDVNINGGMLNIYTDKYSGYSEEITAVSENIYYIRSISTEYKYSVYYFNTESDGKWVNTDGSYKTVSSGRQSYYYYEVEKPSGYQYMIVYVYNSTQEQGQSSSYYRASSQMTLNQNYDTIAFGGYTGGRPGSTSSAANTFSWTNYTTTSQAGPGGMGGPGGMNDGNSDKGDYSTKGIKADNEITVTGGTIVIKAYDDALHTNNDVTIESGATPTGNITISGGSLTLSSNDYAIHAAGKALVSGGTVNILSSYEGIEGTTVEISGGDVSVISSDDGLNGTGTSGTSIVISGGTLYVYAGGDGVDSNSQTSYSGILFSGGRSVIISYGRADSSIDTEKGYSYTGGYVIGIGLSGGMGGESKNCKDFSSVGKSTTLNLSSGSYLTVKDIATVKMPQAMNALVVLLGSTDAGISQASSTSSTVDANGVAWLK